MSREALIEEIVTHDCYRVRPWLAQLKPDVLDLGANIGVFTMMCVEAGCKVFAVEPDPRAFAELSQVTAEHVYCPANLGGRVSLFQGAVCANWEKRRLFQGVASQQSTLYASDNPSVEVDCRTLLDYRRMSGFTYSPAVQLLKMDIEGAEREVFHDIDTLERFDVIVMEWHNHDALLYKRILESASFGFVVRVAGGGHPTPRYYHPMIGGGLLWAVKRCPDHVRATVTKAWSQGDE